MTTQRRRFRGFAATLALAISLPTFTLVWSAPAQAAGDVCDLCSINFDLGACEDLGGYPYDSTQEDPPPAISGGGAPAPAPEPEPAPAPGPAPAPAPAPAPSGGSTSGQTTAGSTSTGTTPGSTDAAATAGQPAAVAQTAPQAPAAPKLTVRGTALTVSWAAPVDGGSPVTGYKLSLNRGTAIPLAAGATTYTFKVLGAGDYTATIVATNALGDSPASAASATAKIAAPDSAGSASTASVDATAVTTEGAPSWLAGAGILVALVAVGGLALLGQRLLRRRKAVAPDGPDSPADSGVTTA